MNCRDSTSPNKLVSRGKGKSICINILKATAGIRTVSNGSFAKNMHQCDQVVRSETSQFVQGWLAKGCEQHFLRSQQAWNKFQILYVSWPVHTSAFQNKCTCSSQKLQEHSKASLHLNRKALGKGGGCLCFDI